MKGRKPAPTALKLLDGTRKDRVNPAEPRANPGRPACPDYLDDVAKAKWSEMVAVIEPMGTLTLAEGEALALYCGAFSRLRLAQATLAVGGLTISGASGGEKANPAIGVIASCESVMLKIISEFGLTPSSRSKVKGNVEGPKDALEDLLSRRPGG